MNKVIDVRAHHLLCMQGFQGYGYSDGFTSHMKKVINILKNKATVRIIDRCDEICSMCPNNCDKICADVSKVAKMDKLVLKKLQIEKEKIIDIEKENIFKYVNEKLQNKKIAEDICGQCSWKKVCLWFKKAQN